MKVYSQGETATYAVKGASLTSLSNVYWAVNVKGGERYAFKCPFCGKADKCWVSYLANSYIKDKGAFIKFGRSLVYCYRCEFNKNQEQRRLFWKHLNLKENELLENNVEYKELEKETNVDKLANDFPVSIPINSDDVPEKALEYLKERKFDKQELYDSFRVLYSEDTRYFRYPYLIIPVFDNYQLVTWQGRYVGEDFKEKDTPKYYFYPSAVKSKLLYNSDIARLYNKVILTEGIFDVMRTGPEAVALFGKKASRLQYQKICSLWKDKDVIILLDKDAYKESCELNNKLKLSGAFKSVKNIVLKKGDPAENTREHIHSVIMNNQ